MPRQPPPDRSVRASASGRSATRSDGPREWSHPEPAFDARPVALAQVARPRARHLHGDLLRPELAAHAAEHASPERPLAERRVLGVVEREEEDPPDDAGGHRDEELGALEDVAVLAREGERVAADEIAVGED